MSTAAVLVVLFALYRAIRGYFLSSDLRQAEHKETLLQTVIGAKSRDIEVDRAEVKETGEAYEANKRNLNPKPGKSE